MKNKIFIFSLALFLAFSLISNCFAANEMEDDMNAVGNTVQDAGNAVGNAVEDAGNAAGNVVEGVGNEAGNLVEDADNSINSDTTENLTGDYNTTKTNAEDVTATVSNNATMWMWIMLAVIAVLIIALVWYYAASSNNSKH